MREVIGPASEDDMIRVFNPFYRELRTEARPPCR